MRGCGRFSMAKNMAKIWFDMAKKTMVDFEDGMKMVKHWPLAIRRNGEHKVKNTIIFSEQIRFGI
jgi:hypothetical protein